MSLNSTRRALSLVAAAGMIVSVSAAQPAQGQESVPPAQAAGSPDQALDLAVEMINGGQAVRARAMLLDLSNSPQAASLTKAQRSRLSVLLTNAGKRVSGMNPMDVSVQTAEVALKSGDLALASRHARAVIDSPKATNEQSSQARDLLARIQAAQASVAPRVDALLNSAGDEIAAGRVGAARASLADVRRSGVSLTPAQEETLTNLQLAVMASEAPAAGMMQPGVIRPRDEKPAQPAQPDNKQPETKPAAPKTEPKADQPPAKPAEPAKPAADQPAATQPATPPPAAPPGPDPIEQAKAWEAQSVLASADKAYDEARYNDALKAYDRLLRTFDAYLTAEQRQHATERRAEAQVRIGGAGGNLLDTTIGVDNMLRQQVTAEFRNDMEQADRALAAGDPEGARNLTATANLRISSNQRLFSQPQVDAYRKQVADMFAKIDREAERIRVQGIRDEEERARRERDMAANTAAENRARQISESFARVRALQAEQKYAEALQVVQNILFLDPTNATAQLLKPVFEDILIYRESLQVSDAAARGHAFNQVDNAKALIPPSWPMEYPADWAKISYTRGTPEAYSESAENRRVLAVLDSRRIPVNFNDVAFGSVVDFIRGVTQLNVDVDWASLEEVSISRDDAVNLNLTNVSLRTALDRVVEKVSKDTTASAAWAVQDGVLTIASRAVINRNKVLAIYDIHDLLIEVPDYTDAPEFDLQSVLQASQGGGGGGQSPFRDTNNQDREMRTLEERTQDIVTLITTNVDQPGWQDNGGDVGFIQQFQGQLLITNTPANHREVEGLLSKLRAVRAMQINVETRFLLVSQDFFEQIGFDLDVYWNADNNQVRAARAANPGGSIQPSDFFDFAGRSDSSNAAQSGAPATPRLNNGIRRSITGANGTNTITPLPSPMSLVGSAQNSLGLAEFLTPGDFASSILQRAPALGVAGQFLDDIQVDFLVKATQADRRTVSLTAPRLTFTNGQWAHIAVATQVAFISDLQPVVSESAVGFDPDLATVSEGVVLLTQGTISADRRYVTLNVEADVGRIDGFSNAPVTAIAGGQLVNSAATQSFVQLPTVTVTRVRTTVTVPDQGTVMLGGQRIITEAEIESGVPVLSKMPILNRFFSNRIQSREEQTLLILIKPTILIQSEQEERAFPGLNESNRIPFGG